MGLRDRWRQYRNNVEAEKKSLALNYDTELIAKHAPELIGKSDVEGMGYVLEQIQMWKRSCSSEEADAFTDRLRASQETWKADGLIMPYWGNLWVLRTFQAELDDTREIAEPH